MLAQPDSDKVHMLTTRVCLLVEGLRTRVGQTKTKYWKLHELHIDAESLILAVLLII